MESLSSNTTISHYRIISKLGAGGMGEVYLAQDTKLDRKVAIKFLHEEFSKDTDKLSRFIQEAKAAFAGLGEKDEAFGWLEKSFQDHSSLLVDLRIDPSFAPLRDDPRYKDFLKRMGLPE